MAEPSNSGALWSDLYYLYFAVAAIVGALVVGWLFYNLWTFRYRPDRPRPADAPIAGAVPVERGHPLWSYVMAGLIAIIMFGLAFGTISAVQTIENPPPGGDHVDVRVEGFQFGWDYFYQSDSGIPVRVATPGSESFTVPKDAVVVLNITSRDVWHNFAIPDFRIRVDAIPGTVNLLWFNASQTGDYRNVCVQICGLGHANMHTMMKVVERAEFDPWFAAKEAAAYKTIEDTIAKNASRGAIVNATANGASIVLDDASIVAGRPVVVNLTNVGTTPLAIHLGNGFATVAPGAWGRVYAVAPSEGALELAAGDARATLEVGA